MNEHDDDRFGDLGPKPTRRADDIGRLLAERDQTHPEPDTPKRPEVPRPGNKYAWLVGILMLMAIGVLLFTTAIPNKGKGLHGPRHGVRTPRFAAPLATSELKGPANVCQKRPCSDRAGPYPACSGKDDRALHVCDLWTRPLVLTFIWDRAADCFPQVDRVQRLMNQTSGVGFAVVYFTHKDRKEVQEIVDRRGWTMPIAVDQDGTITNLYGIGVCPTTVFARKGGKVVTSKLGNLTEADIRREIKRLKG